MLKFCQASVKNNCYSHTFVTSVYMFYLMSFNKFKQGFWQNMNKKWF